MSTMTDAGNADRFVSLHGENVRYCNPMRGWYIWNGKYWAFDETQQVALLVEETAKSISKEAAKVGNLAESMQLSKWATTSLQRNRLNNMLALAQARLPITPDEFDKNHWQLNVQNGTVDLKIGQLVPHDRSNYISKIAPVTFDPEATCPLWERTLNTIFDGDDRLIRYMQKVIGYALTGDVSEKCFFVLHGSGDNGKTLMMNAVMEVFGDYAASTAMDTFIVTLPGAASSDVMRLKGARLAMASEAEKQYNLAEAKIKRLTGGDKYTACFKYKEPIDFYPEFKIFLLTNQIPRFNITDKALLNRIRMIPFNVAIPPEQQDKHLLDKLKLECSGILNWAITGCLLWQQEGLEPPKTVVDALEDHRLQIDVVARFLNECCVLDPGSKVGVTPLHEAYKEWAISNDLDIMGRKVFNTALNSRGYQRAPREPGGFVWSGIKLNDLPVQDAAVGQ